jgi:hypothetical protein
VAFNDFEAVEVGDLNINVGDRIKILSKELGIDASGYPEGVGMCFLHSLLLLCSLLCVC